MLLHLSLLAFFCFQIAAVIGQKDPWVSSYEVLVDRSSMEEPMHLDDYSSRFFFGFLDENNDSVALDPSIGHFELNQIESGQKTETTNPRTESKTSTIPIEVVGLAADEEQREIL